MNNKHKSAFVTGAGGFIGTRLVSRLLAEGWQVQALLLANEPEPAIWQQRAQILRGDVRHPEDYLERVREGAYLFHLAALVGDWGSLAEHRSVTVDGTARMIELALNKAASRFILLSSIVVYGDRIGSGWLDETMPLGQALTAYDTCKQEQERLLMATTKERLLPWTIIRPANVYGPNSGPWVNTLIAEMRRHSPVLIGGGDHDAGLVHVDNLVGLIVLAASAANAVGQIYNAADGFGVTWKRYASDLAQAAGLGRPLSIPYSLARVLAYGLSPVFRLLNTQRRPPITPLAFRLVGHANQFSIAKAQRELGYQPAVSYQQAMQNIL